MTVDCKRCGYSWMPRTSATPNICPRCKSAKWAEAKKRAWEKINNVYVVLFDNELKVGRSMRGNRRTKAYSNVVEAYVSKPCSHVQDNENKLINRAISLCGQPIRGREYFRGNKKEYDSLVTFIKDEIETVTYLKTDAQLFDDFDFTKVLCQFALEAKLPMMMHIREVVLNERKQFMLAVNEAKIDAANGVCSYEWALNGLLDSSVNMFDSARKEAAKKNSDLKEYDDIVHDIIEELR